MVSLISAAPESIIDQSRPANLLHCYQKVNPKTKAQLVPSQESTEVSSYTPIIMVTPPKFRPFLLNNDDDSDTIFPWLFDDQNNTLWKGTEVLINPGQLHPP